jgi:XFP-like protein
MQTPVLTPEVLTQLSVKGAYLKQIVQDKLIEHKVHINQHGEDMPEIRNWKWPVNTKGGTKTIKPRAELETAQDG